MKAVSIAAKSLKEQVRSFWILLLTLMMGTFFIFVYYLITESTMPHYELIIINKDKGIENESGAVNLGEQLLDYFEESSKESGFAPFSISISGSREESVGRLKSKEAEALIIIDDEFTIRLSQRMKERDAPVAGIEFIGDLTSTNYLLSAVWAGEIINGFISEYAGENSYIKVTETPLGVSGIISEFDLVVPGILIVSLIMLMFTASIAFVAEVENRTMLRLRMSEMKAYEFLSGITAVQLLVGIISMLLTLLTAVMLGFSFTGSIWALIIISALTSLSIIAFSLIIAAFTKTANEVLVVGNFPMFLFMFFTGAAFPLKAEPIFFLAGYPVSVQGLMTPTHAISALNKTLVMDMGLSAVMTEISSILILTVIYFLAGAFIFRRRHLKNY